MSFIKVQGLMSAVEPVTVPEGEYDLVIIKGEYADLGEKGIPALQFLLEISGEANSKIVSHTLWLPGGKDDERQKANSLWRIRSWCEAFGIPINDEGIDLDGCQGLSARCLLTEEDTAKYGPTNRIKKVLNP